MKNESKTVDELVEEARQTFRKMLSPHIPVVYLYDYILNNYAPILLEILKYDETVPSVHDIHIIQAASRQTSNRMIPKQILMVYKSRKKI